MRGTRKTDFYSWMELMCCRDGPCWTLPADLKCLEWKAIHLNRHYSMTGGVWPLFGIKGAEKKLFLASLHKKKMTIKNSCVDLSIHPINITASMHLLSAFKKPNLNEVTTFSRLILFQSRWGPFELYLSWNETIKSLEPLPLIWLGGIPCQPHCHLLPPPIKNRAKQTNGEEGRMERECLIKYGLL